MVEICRRQIPWHIFKIFNVHGINEFVICCGFKGYVMKECFENCFLHMADVAFHKCNNCMEEHRKKAELWEIALVDTGEAMMTGGPLQACAQLCRQ
jgi:glucose-1-phosphate cytidylyltransferase